MKGGGGVEWLEHHFFSQRYERGVVVEWLEHHFFSQRYEGGGGGGGRVVRAPFLQSEV